MEKLVFSEQAKFTLATNTFVRVPVILKFEDLNLIEIVRAERLQYTTQFQIYNSDGVYMAKIKGNRPYPTEEGKKSGLRIDRRVGVDVCMLDNKILYELRHQTGEQFKMQAELFSPEGYLIKVKDAPMPGIIDASGQALNIGGNIFSRCLFSDLKIGIWLRKNGAVAIGVN